MWSFQKVLSGSRNFYRGGKLAEEFVESLGVEYANGMPSGSSGEYFAMRANKSTRAFRIFGSSTFSHSATLPPPPRGPALPDHPQ